MLILAYCLFAVGAFVSILNFHLSFIRPLICRLRRQQYRFVSGFPLVGSLLLIVSFFCFPRDHSVRWATLIIALFDTGGIHWFCGMMVYDAFRGRRSQTGGDRPFGRAPTVGRVARQNGPVARSTRTRAAPFSQIAIECAGAGIINGWIYLSTFLGGFHPIAIAFPWALVASSAIGFAAGLVLSPVVFLLRRQKLRLRLGLYALVFAMTALGNQFNPHIGLRLPVPLLICLCLLAWLMRRPDEKPANGECPDEVATNPRDEPFQCVQCGKTIPGGESRCVQCGWSYETNLGQQSA